MAKFPHKSPTFRIRYEKSPVEDGPGSTSPTWGDGPPASAAPRILRMRILDATIEASLGKVWWYRSPLLISVAWIFYRHVTDSEYGRIFAGINLAIHEGGHLFFMWFGNDFLTVAGGTFFQCVCPIVTGIMFYKQRDFFAISVACFWLGTNFAHIAPYAADARAQMLPLVSPFQGVPGHDWNYLLGTLRLLGQDRVIGGAFKVAGVLTMGAGFFGGLWVLRVMAMANEAGKHFDPVGA
jgi:hypothetical protein